MGARLFGMGVVRRIAAAFALSAWTLLVAQPGTPTAALAAVAVAGLVAALATARPAPRRTPATTPHEVRAVALRRRARRTVYLPARDPSAPGRPRPRAPSRRAAARPI